MMDDDYLKCTVCGEEWVVYGGEPHFNCLECDSKCTYHEAQATNHTTTQSEEDTMTAKTKSKAKNTKKPVAKQMTAAEKKAAEQKHNELMSAAMTLEQYLAEGKKAMKTKMKGGKNVESISQSDARLLYDMAVEDGLSDEELETLRTAWKLTATKRKSTKKEKAPKVPKEKKPARETMPAGSWSKYFLKCTATSPDKTACGETDHKHYSGGQCTKCYTIDRNARLIAEGKMVDPAIKAAERLAAKEAAAEAKAAAKLEAKIAKEAEKAAKKDAEAHAKQKLPTTKKVKAAKKPVAKKTTTKKKAKA